MKRLLFPLVVILVLGAGCAHHHPVPTYYKLPEQEMKRGKKLSATVRVDSLDLELLEWAVFSETNQQRQRLGLAPTRYDYRLQAAARQHSTEMVEMKYFDHNSPVNKNETVKRRLKNAGIRYGAGGENIAIHPVRKRQEIVFRLTGSDAPKRYSWRNTGKQYTYGQFAEDLVLRWLNSAPHRNNILNRGYRFLGVGAMPSRVEGSEVFYVTQNFSSTNF